jgi:hypothetical protein
MIKGSSLSLLKMFRIRHRHDGKNKWAQQAAPLRVTILRSDMLCDLPSLRPDSVR